MSANGHPVFVGYGSPQDWFESIHVRSAVYADLVAETHSLTTTGLRTDHILIILAQPGMDGLVVHYCRIPVGYLEYVGSTPFSSNHEQRRAAAMAAWDIVRAWLEGKGLILRRAAVAMPRDYRYIDGDADFLHYDREAKTFVYREATDEPAA